MRRAPLLRAICRVAFACHCCVAFGGISPFGDFQCALARCPGKPMDVPVQLKQYKGQEDEVYDKALKKGYAVARTVAATAHRMVQAVGADIDIASTSHWAVQFVQTEWWVMASSLCFLCFVGPAMT